MSGNTFGKLFCVTSFGESHGPAIGCVVDGCRPGLALTRDDIQRELDRRKPGTSRHVTQRREWDTVDGDEGREEFGPANHDIDYLRARVQRTQEFVHTFLDGVTSEELSASRVHPKRPITFVAR